MDKISVLLVVDACLSNPMLNIDFSGVTSAFIHISGGIDLTLIESEKILSDLTRNLVKMSMFFLGSQSEMIWKEK